MDTARSYSTFRLIWVIETMVLVTDVPMLAPMTMGMALATFKAPPATRPTTMAVVEEEDWMIEVERIPINSPTSGLVVVAIRVSAKPSPNILSEAPMSSRLNRKR